MINKEIIDNAANEHACSVYDSTCSRYDSKESFKAGVNWTIKQMSNDAMEFAIWTQINCWRKHFIRDEWTFTSSSGPKNDREYTTIELYQLYLKNKTK